MGPGGKTKVDHRNFKLYFFYSILYKLANVGKIKSLQNQVAKVWGLKLERSVHCSVP